MNTLSSTIEKNTEDTDLSRSYYSYSRANERKKIVSVPSMQQAVVSVTSGKHYNNNLYRNHEMNTLSTTIEKNTEDTDLFRSYTVIQGPMKEKIPPSLVISYTTLRVLNPIGQGTLIFFFFFLYDISA